MALIKSKQLDLSNDFAFTGGVSLTTAPTSGNDVVNKTYVDSLSTASSAGLDFKESVRVATTESLSITYSAGVLTATSNGALTVDGVSVTAGASEALSMRVLVKDQANSADNGIYYCSQTGDASNPFTLTRATDADSNGDINTGCFVFVEDGTANQNKAFVLQANNDGTSPELGTDDLNFIQFSGAGQITAGSALAKSGDTLSLDIGSQNSNLSEYTGDALQNPKFVAYVSGANKALTLANISKILVGASTASNASSGLEQGSSYFYTMQVKAGAGITVDANGVNAALPQLDSGSPSGTLSSDESQTGITIGDTPAGDSNVRVTVNGVGVALKGDKTGDAYFSNDAGTTARALADIASGDELIWNGTSGAYALEATDIVEIFYNA
jgi:hypothetical protein